jgi:hypothetical protein
MGGFLCLKSREKTFTAETYLQLGNRGDQLLLVGDGLTLEFISRIGGSFEVAVCFLRGGELLFGSSSFPFPNPPSDIPQLIPPFRSVTYLLRHCTRLVTSCEFLAPSGLVHELRDQRSRKY